MDRQIARVAASVFPGQKRPQSPRSLHVPHGLKADGPPLGCAGVLRGGRRPPTWPPSSVKQVVQLMVEGQQVLDAIAKLQVDTLHHPSLRVLC